MDDLDVKIEEGRYLASKIPDARLVELPGADHGFWGGDTGSLIEEIEEFITGHRDVGGPERVLATVLFTDIVDSTMRAAALGDSAWRDLLDRHHATVRAELARWRGKEIATAGDGFFATFDGPARAIRCARAVADGVGSLGIAVRCGLHTGEVETRGHDVSGLAVHIGARIAGLADAGEVLVSRMTADGVGVVRELLVRFASSPAATEAQAQAFQRWCHARSVWRRPTSARVGRAGGFAVARRRARRPKRAGAPAMVRCSWLPSALPAVVERLDECRKVAPIPAFVGRAVVGAGVLRIGGTVAVQQTVINCCTSGGPTAHVVVLTGSPDVERKDAETSGAISPSSWAAPLAALSRSFDPAGILGAGRGPL